MKFLRWIGVFLLSFSMLFTLLFGYKKISKGYSFGTAQSYKGILTLWQVDSFEGGVGSRKQFLLKVARTFEKQNQGVLVMVIDRTPESVKESMEKGEFPDMISFGAGVEVSNFLELKTVRATLGGKVGERHYATAWCRGGYVLIANPKLVSEFPKNIDKLLVSQGEYNSPLTALALEGILASDITIKTPMNAYVQFVSGNTPYFLGTQRDINRLERRGFEVITKPLSEYCDLYQYISVTSTDSLKNYYSEKFIELLTSKAVQENLNQIGMLSENYVVEYDNQHLVDMQNVKIKSTISAFTHFQSIKELCENSLSFLKGQKEMEIKIKNMLV